MASASVSASSPPPLSFNVVGSDTLTYSNTVRSTPPPSSSPLQSISPTILITIIALAAAVIFSVALCFIIPRLNRRRLRRMSPSSAAPALTTAPVFSSSRRVSPEVPSSSVIDSLPLFTFSSITRRSSASTGDCAVCLSKFEQDDLLRLLPLCCHAFHAECVDTWLQSNLTCPLCRSAVFASEADIMKILRQSSSAAGGNSFRLEIGNVSHRGDGSEAGEARGRSRSYSIGSFEYFVDDYTEVPFSHAHRRSVSDNKDETVLEFQGDQPVHEPSLVADVGSGRSWLKDYVDRLSASLSSRTMSFRSSGRFFNGSSSRRSDTIAAGDYDVESNGIGEEISEMFRWLSGI